MSLVKCARAGCPNKIREGLRRPYYDKTTRGKEKADGHLCWRCRDGRSSHLQKLYRQFKRA